MTGERSRATRLTLVAHAARSPGPSLRFGIEEPASDRIRELLGRKNPMPFSSDGALRSPSPAAEATASALGHAEAPIDQALRDRGYGAWSGRTMEEVATAQPTVFKRWLEDPSAAAPGGESVQDLVERARGWLDSLTGSGQSLLAITHPPVIRACLVAALACPADAWFGFDVGYATRTVLTHGGKRWRVGLVNAPL